MERVIVVLVLAVLVPGEVTEAAVEGMIAVLELSGLPLEWR